MALTPAELDAAQAQINAARDQAATNIDLARGWADIAEAAAEASGSGSAQVATAEANRAAQQKALAETARTGAETARTGAEAARSGAETARTGAQTARGLAEDARDRAEAVPPTVDALVPDLIADPDSATRVALDHRYPTIVSPEMFGAVGDGVADDRAAIQSAIDACPLGGQVQFLAGRTYAIGGTVYLLPRRYYTSAGPANAGTTKILVRAGSSWSGPMLAADVYRSARLLCDEPVYVSNLFLDGNNDNTTGTNSGLLLINYWSKVHGVYIENLDGAGITLTDRRADGGDVTNSCSENSIRESKFHNVHTAVKQESKNFISNQDGYIDDLLISNVVRGLDFERGSGWAIRRCHIYNVDENAIDLRLCFATVLADNYVENFGMVPGWWSGISVHQLAGVQSVISGNQVHAPSSPTANALAAFFLGPAWGEVGAAITFTGNTIMGTVEDNCSAILGERQGGDSVGTLSITEAATSIVGVWETRLWRLNAGVTRELSHEVLTQAEAEGGTSTAPRSITAATLRGSVQRWVTGTYGTAVSTIGQNLARAANAAAARSAIGAVARSGETVEVWSGTQVAYDALPTATKNALGFIAVIR